MQEIIEAARKEGYEQGRSEAKSDVERGVGEEAKMESEQEDGG